MAESAESISAGPGGAPEHGRGPLGFIKRIKPGEWILIAIGVIGIVAYVVWYRNQQNSTAGFASGTNPNWQNAQAQPGDPFSQEVGDLLSLIGSGAFSTPGTSPTNSTTSGGGDSGGGGAGIAGSAAGQGLAATNPLNTGIVGTGASSGSGLSMASSNKDGSTGFSSYIYSSPLPALNSLGLPANTGTVGAPISGGVSNAPVVYAPNSVIPNQAGVGSGYSPVGAVSSVTGVQPSSVNLVVPNTGGTVQTASVGAEPAAMETVTHSTAPVVSAPPTKAPVSAVASHSYAAPSPPPPPPPAPPVARALTSRLGR